VYVVPYAEKFVLVCVMLVPLVSLPLVANMLQLPALFQCHVMFSLSAAVSASFIIT